MNIEPVSTFLLLSDHRLFSFRALPAGTAEQKNAVPVPLLTLLEHQNGNGTSSRVSYGFSLEKRCSGKNRHSGFHDFSVKIKCGECGSWYGSKVWHSTDKYRKAIWRCNHKYGGEKCSTPHLTDDEIKAAFVSATNKALADKDTVIETFRLIRDSVFDTSALEQERTELTDELNIVAGLIQDGIYQNAHVAQNQADYNKEYESLAARYEKAKSRLETVEAEIHDKQSRRKSIEHYLEILQERQDAVTEYDVTLWHGMVEFVTVYSKDDIRFTMKDGTEIRA